MKMTSFGSLKRLFACLSVPREVVSYLLSGSFDLSFQICALGHVRFFACILVPGRSTMKRGALAENTSLDILRLCHGTLDSRTLRIELHKRLQTVIPFDYS